MKAKFVLTACALVIVSVPALAEIKVGVIVGATGPGASLGIPIRNTFDIVPDTLGGEPVRYIVVDDSTDTTQAVRNARKLIEEDKVDMLLGSSSVPAAIAVAGVALEMKTPQVAFSPIGNMAEKNPWAFSVPQPTTLIMSAVAEDMHKKGITRVGFIGFNDSWGEQVYSGFRPHAERLGIEIVANERYARLDTTVNAQVLKVLTTKPDAMVIGGSGTPAVLPHATLRKLGYKGPIYHNHAVINAEFLRVGGASVEGAIASTGPIAVADQLPDDNPIKGVALKAIGAYEAKFGKGTYNPLGAYAYDAYLLADDAVRTAVKTAKPGTPEFKTALRDALENVKELAGTHGVYNTTPADHTGLDERARVLVVVEDGKWKLVK